MTQAQDEYQFSPEKLQKPELMMSGRKYTVGQGVANLEEAVATGHTTAEEAVVEQSPIVPEQVRPAQAYAPIQIDAAMEARKTLARLHGESND